MPCLRCIQHSRAGSRSQRNTCTQVQALRQYFSSLRPNVTTCIRTKGIAALERPFDGLRRKSLLSRQGSTWLEHGGMGVATLCKVRHASRSLRLQRRGIHRSKASENIHKAKVILEKPTWRAEQTLKTHSTYRTRCPQQDQGWFRVLGGLCRGVSRRAYPTNQSVPASSPSRLDQDPEGTGSHPCAADSSHMSFSSGRRLP